MSASGLRERGGAAGLLSRLTTGTATVFALLVVLLVVITILNPGFARPPSLMAFLRAAAPLVVLAVGQYLVIVAGELDLSVGALVGAQVVFAARMIDGVEGRTWSVIAAMLAIGLLVGLVNGLITTLLRVPSFITTLGTLLVLFGAVRLWTGGAPTGALSESFRQWGRQGIDMPVLRQLPYALLIALVIAVLATLLMRAPYGRTLVATGDNDVAAAFAGVRVWRVRTVAFVLSSLLATVAAILIGGFAGVTAQVGQGLEFTAITAVVLGGVVLGGGRGTVMGAIAGALAYQAIERLFTQLALPSTARPALQGVIIIAAVAWAARDTSRSGRSPVTGHTRHRRPAAHRLRRRCRRRRRDRGPTRPTTDRTTDEGATMKPTPKLLLACLIAMALAIAGCTTDEPAEESGDAGEDAAPTEAADEEPADEEPADEEPAATEGGEEAAEGGAEEGEFFVREDYERQLAQRDVEPEGDPAEPWLQAIDPEMVDTSEYAVEEDGQTLCFSNASISNPWRVTGWITMQQQVEVFQESGEIGEFRVADAADDDNQQISDIQSFIDSGDCGAIIISPSTTATLTPIVEEACASGVPVIVFDRGVNTDCMVTFIHPIGGYAYGADGAEFLVENLEEGDTVLALRILPGVDVLENRWAAAQEIFADSGLEVLGDEFTGGDAAQIKDIVTQYLQRGDVDGIWMDAGDGSVAALEAFEDAGVDYPVMVGEDEMSFLRKWEETGITAIAPVYSNFQWRTPVIAAVRIWDGEEVPSEWVLPQEPITEDQLGEFLEANADMPSLHYAKFGGEDLPGFPEAWTDR